MIGSLNACRMATLLYFYKMWWLLLICLLGVSSKAFSHSSECQRHESSFVFVVPEWESRISLGVYNASDGQLVKILAELRPEDQFTASLDGLEITWDACNERERDVRARNYDIRGYACRDINARRVVNKRGLLRIGITSSEGEEKQISLSKQLKQGKARLDPVSIMISDPLNRSCVELDVIGRRRNPSILEFYSRSLLIGRLFIGAHIQDYRLQKAYN